MQSQNAVVVGAGTMGTGIAQVAALAGWTVHLCDENPAALERAEGGLKKSLDRLVETGRLPSSEREVALHRIHVCRELPRVGDIAMAMEAVVEDFEVKRRVFAGLDERMPPEAILATNTSSLSVSRLAAQVRQPSRVIGMHFFNPAPLMPLVEVIAGRQSDPAYVHRGVQIAREWGKVTVIAKDTPGFIVNRVARGYYLEALRLLGEGVAGVDEIDAVMRTHGGFKMGPFQLMDLVGLDVNLAVSTSVWEQMGKPARLIPHSIQQNLVSRGQLGRKTKRGFYAYEDGATLAAVTCERKNFPLSPLLSDVLRAFAQRSGAHDAGATEQFVFGRILSSILNEAGWALHDEVATRTDIDLAMVKGTNYPKGPLAWVDIIGPNTVRGLLCALNETLGDGRYEPAPLFRS